MMRGYTPAEAAERLSVSAYWVREQCRDLRSPDGTVVRPALVRPMRLSDGPKARIRLTDADLAELEAALRPPPATPTRRRSRRRH